MIPMLSKNNAHHEKDRLGLIFPNQIEKNCTMSLQRHLGNGNKYILQELDIKELITYFETKLKDRVWFPRYGLTKDGKYFVVDKNDKFTNEIYSNDKENILKNANANECVFIIKKKESDDNDNDPYENDFIVSINIIIIIEKIKDTEKFEFDGDIISCHIKKLYIL